MSVVESQDILFNSNFETLYAYMSSALDAGDYKTAKLYASFCEISLPNIDRNHDIVQQFYAIQMVLTSFLLSYNILIIKSYHDYY